MHENHLERLLKHSFLGSIYGHSESIDGGRTHGFSFLLSSQMISIMPVRRPPFKNHCVGLYCLIYINKKVSNEVEWTAEVFRFNVLWGHSGY